MEKKKKEILRIAVFAIALGLFVGFLIGFGVGIDNSKYIQLKEDYDWLKESSINCWNKLRVLDTECWDASDCFENQNLEGCNKVEGDCNWCCLNSCTVMGSPN